MRKFYVMLYFLVFSFIYSEDLTDTATNLEKTSNLEKTTENKKFIEADGTIKIPEKPKDGVIFIPMIPLEPAIRTKGQDITEKEVRDLEKTFSIYLDQQMEVYVPLEVITDIDVDSTVLGNEIVTAPFEINLNKKPDRQNYYSIKYSQELLDIDGDGEYDTKIFSPKYINDKKETNNYVQINGGKVSREGKHQKQVYITVEAGGE